MSQLRGTFLVDVGALAEQVADLVVARLQAAARQATSGGSHVYDRDEDVHQGSGRPWPGPRHDDDQPEPSDG